MRRPPPPVEAPAEPSSQPVDTAQFAWSTKPGTAAIIGSVAYSGQGGAYTCANGAVVLTPDTPYSRRRIVRLYGTAGPVAVPVATVRARQTARAGGDYSAFVRNTKCDANGQFVFKGLPPGGWFAISIARSASGAGEAMALVRFVRTTPGQASRITLP